MKIASEPNMAAISLHALMRHQNHRRMNTAPTPAPRAARNAQASSTFTPRVIMNHDTAPPSSSTMPEAMRLTRSSCWSPACGATKRL
jgi:hypothetical protein